MRWKAAAVAALGVTMTCGTTLAQAAPLPTLDGLTGAVFVDQGNGFQAATDRTVLHRGDRVIAGRGGLARLAYADGCTTRVTSRTLATVDAVSPCAGGVGTHAVRTAYRTADGDSGGGGGGGLGGLPPAGYIIGGLAVAGLIGIVVAGTSQDSSGSTSP